MDNDRDDSNHKRRDREVSYDYYHQEIPTADGVDTTLLLNNSLLQQEFYVRGNKVSQDF